MNWRPTLPPRRPKGDFNHAKGSEATCSKLDESAHTIEESVRASNLVLMDGAHWKDLWRLGVSSFREDN